jgi:hypothetical protein
MDQCAICGQFADVIVCSAQHTTCWNCFAQHMAAQLECTCPGCGELFVNNQSNGQDALNLYRDSIMHGLQHRIQHAKEMSDMELECALLRLFEATCNMPLLMWSQVSEIATQARGMLCSVCIKITCNCNNRQYCCVT